jgi:hypothetical protein
VVAESLRYCPEAPKTPTYTVVRTAVEAAQSPALSAREGAALYRARLLPHFPPTMHRWFSERFRCVRTLCCL